MLICTLNFNFHVEGLKPSGFCLILVWFLNLPGNLEDLCVKVMCMIIFKVGWKGTNLITEF